MQKIKRLFFSLLAILISLVAVDLMLHTASFFSSRANEITSIISAKIPDQRLGHRPNPAYPDHDENGFRNPHFPKKSHIVALGDSQTYGSGVKADQAWPRVLESLTGQSVYSMALGGYGPVHSLLLWDEAVALKPEIIIDGIYSGNDLHDSFSIVYNQNKLSELKIKDKNMQEIILRAEQSEPIQERVSKMYKRGKTRSGMRISIKAWFSENSKVYGLLRRAQYELSRARKANKPARSAEEKWKKAKSFAVKNSKYAQQFSTDNSRTIFTSEYRLAALNLEDPRIREGQRISFEAIRQMQQLALRDSIRYIVLMIPTKELVFNELAKAIDSPNYHTLIRNELQFWEETRLFLDQHSIEYIDGLNALRAGLEKGPQTYKVSHNGHPNEHGQRAIAEVVQSYLESE